MEITALFTSPFGPLVLRPTFDRLAVAALVRLYFPASRLWALALADSCSGETLLDAVPCLGRYRRRLDGALAETRGRQVAYAAAASSWQAAFFGNSVVSVGDLRDLEDTRAGAAQRLMAARRNFLPLVRRARITPFGWDIATHAAVKARHGGRLDGTVARFALPDIPLAMELSRAFPGDGYETLWLRAPTSVAGVTDTIWARVERPLGRPRGALVFAHGIAMETEFWCSKSRLIGDLARAGIVVVRPEGPWHGRRRVAGTFGGEPVLAPSPMGLLDYFEAHVRELACLVRWARAATGGASVAVGGVSLGALTAQMALDAAGAWPAVYRPDAGFLVATAGSLLDVTMDGHLTGALGLPGLLKGAGWDSDALKRWMPLLQPDAVLALPPERIVAVLGTRDAITPYDSGLALMERWGVPSANRFVRPLGHFTASLDLYRDPAPLERLREVMIG